MASINDFTANLRSYSINLTAKFALPVQANPEDQLKGPVEDVLKAAGDAFGLSVETLTETPVADLSSRPDMAVAVKSLLAGHIELKAPGKGADPNKFRGPDREQWAKFRDLPNIIYTDGNDWALYRSGERAGKLVRLSGDVTSDGAKAVSASDAEALLELLRDFLHWHPIAPGTPRALAEMLAPICRILRSDVTAALQSPQSALRSLAADWRNYLFPDADDPQFADAYAQTLVYALLLAKLSGGVDVSVAGAVKAIRSGHRLLADTLKILGDEDASHDIRVPLDLLERIVDAVDPTALTQKGKDDPWLYFYEDFLAAYDPKMRNDRGVYYTPVPVVQTQVNLVAQLLAERLGYEFAFVDPHVVTLDPAGGTGTYALAAVAHSLDRISDAKGPGMRKSAATQAAANMHVFEILVGPYAVAHLRLTQQILKEGGTLPPEGVHVYLTDTLESPAQPEPKLPTLYMQLGEEHRRARRIKQATRVLVCMGNPPYDRQQFDQEEAHGAVKRKGGWVRYGDQGIDGTGILKDFIAPLTPIGLGLHAKNLYNDYVYFWRWVLWKVFETASALNSPPGPGIVSFITASSYLRGPGFAGMRQFMRQTLDELWIIDLEGDNLGARKTENVFAIRTPVAIAIGVRYGAPRPDTPAHVHYARIEGTQQEKYAQLTAVTRSEDLRWQDCLTAWTDPFLPKSDKAYWEWPLLTDIFPWQENGVQFKRTWPIGETADVLQRRWAALLEAPASQRSGLLRETDARKVNKSYTSLDDTGTLVALASFKPGDSSVPPTRYAFRSFDREWVLQDIRLCDRPRPTLLRAHGSNQIYMTSLLTKVMGEGPAAVATALIPDLDHFCNRGARDVIPLWRNRGGTEANVTDGVLEVLTHAYGAPVTGDELLSYCYALLSSPAYVEHFWEELTIPGPRIPLTKSGELFRRAATHGREMIWLHTYGERFVPSGTKPGKLPRGLARCNIGTPTSEKDYPESFSYDAAAQELHVGKGVFGNVRPEVWSFSVSGFEVVKSWLGYRMRVRTGKKSSPLDDIRPKTWQFDEELLDLLWVLDVTVDRLPVAEELLEAVLDSECFAAEALPQPSIFERQGPSAVLQPLLPSQEDLSSDDG